MLLVSTRQVLVALAVTISPAYADPARLPAPFVELPVAKPNDNRVAAGTRRADTVAVSLVVTPARWFPGADNGPSVMVTALAEEGKAPQIPAPLIRVPTGTHIVATVRNALPDSTITIHGLHTRPAAGWGTIRLAPGEAQTIRFTAGEPGTYSYFATIGRVIFPSAERETAAGAFVVDSTGARADDRVFVINIWGNSTESRVSNALAINGKTWPYTERLTASLGDSLRYRIVNASMRAHPMHLHGFYFRVDAQGSGFADTTHAPDRRRLAVTETVFPAGTMTMTWHADRPGNWLLHCHLAFHVVPEVALLEAPAADLHDELSHDANRHMAGLIIGISVRPPREWRESARRDPQHVRLLVQEGPRRGASPRAMGYLLQMGSVSPRPDSIQIPGPSLVLTRGRPADVTVVNHLREPTAVHWHGIELESYSDGVVGWSGVGQRVAPSIAPGDSFIARLTLPRAGTFIYHTHLGDLVQLTAGLYGALLVLEPGERYDPRTDHVVVAGWDGDVRPRRLLVNGDSLPPPLELAAGQRHRLRLVNIGAAGFVRFALKRDTSLVRWRAAAKDGADLPAAAAVERPAVVRINVGETYDAVFDASEPGEYDLWIDLTLRPGVATVTRRQRVIVR